MKSFPRFRRRLPDNVVYLHEGETADIYRSGDAVVMSVSGRWRADYALLARRHCVNELVLSSPVLNRRKSLSFIRDLPPLRSLSVGNYLPLDLSVIADVHSLERLRIHWRCSEAPAPVDLSGLVNLRECDVNLTPAFQSVLRCPSIVRFGAFESAVAELDLAGMPRLTELDLELCSKLHSVRLKRRTKLRALQIVGCKRLAVDWEQVGSTLQYLSLGGTIGFAIEEVVALRKLRFLQLMALKALPRLDFLKKLPNLKTVEWRAGTPRERLSAHNDQLIRAINRQGGHGSVVTPAP